MLCADTAVSSPACNSTPELGTTLVSPLSLTDFVQLIRQVLFFVSLLVVVQANLMTCKRQNVPFFSVTLIISNGELSDKISDTDPGRWSPTDRWTEDTLASKTTPVCCRVM